MTQPEKDILMFAVRPKLEALRDRAMLYAEGNVVNEGESYKSVATIAFRDIRRLAKEADELLEFLLT